MAEEKVAHGDEMEAKEGASVSSSEVSSEAAEEDLGFIKVADEVLEIMAGLAALDVPGVAEMSGGFVGDLRDRWQRLRPTRKGSVSSGGGQDFSKGVRVSVTGKTALIDVFVIVYYNVVIAEVALAIQEKVKKAIESMTDFEVSAVNVYVEGVKRRNYMQKVEGMIEG